MGGRINVIESVDSIIYFVGLSDFIRPVIGNDTTNMMHESLELFNIICNHRYFIHTQIVLMFTKQDLFKKLIYKGFNMTYCFNNNQKWPDYHGKCPSYFFCVLFLICFYFFIFFCDFF